MSSDLLSFVLSQNGSVFIISDSSDKKFDELEILDIEETSDTLKITFMGEADLRDRAYGTCQGMFKGDMSIDIESFKEQAKSNVNVYFKNINIYLSHEFKLSMEVINDITDNNYQEGDSIDGDDFNWALDEYAESMCIMASSFGFQFDHN